MHIFVGVLKTEPFKIKVLLRKYVHNSVHNVYY